MCKCNVCVCVCVCCVCCNKARMFTWETTKHCQEKTLGVFLFCLLCLLFFILFFLLPCFVCVYEKGYLLFQQGIKFCTMCYVLSVIPSFVCSYFTGFLSRIFGVENLFLLTEFFMCLNWTLYGIYNPNQWIVLGSLLISGMLLQLHYSVIFTIIETV